MITRAPKQLTISILTNKTQPELAIEPETCFPYKCADHYIIQIQITGQVSANVHRKRDLKISIPSSGKISSFEILFMNLVDALNLKV